MRNISFMLTTQQFIARTKTVTRRVNWEFLKAGDQLMGVEKGQGLKKGEKITRLGVIRICDVRRERLDYMLRDLDYGRAECEREGFPEMTPSEFVEFFCRANRRFPIDPVTRIGFEYL